MLAILFSMIFAVGAERGFDTIIRDTNSCILLDDSRKLPCRFAVAKGFGFDPKNGNIVHPWDAPIPKQKAVMAPNDKVENLDIKNDTVKTSHSERLVDSLEIRRLIVDERIAKALEDLAKTSSSRAAMAYDDVARTEATQKISVGVGVIAGIEAFWTVIAVFVLLGR